MSHPTSSPSPKGSSSGYPPLGGAIISRRIADTFKEQAYPGGLNYSGRPLVCASAVASINIFEEEGIIQRVRDLGTNVIGPALEKLKDKHPSIGEVRGFGCFWSIELVRNRDIRAPLVPFNATGPAAAPMNAVAAACKADGVWPFIHFNLMRVCPPLIISEADCNRGPEIIDHALDVADSYVS